MDKKSVNIYIATSITGPRRGRGAYMYLMEVLAWKWENGERKQVTVTRQQMTVLEDTTENQSAICALEAALARMTAPSCLTIWTDCQYMYTILANRQYGRWREHDWQNEKGVPVKYADKWRHIAAMLEAHEYEVKLKERHGYTDWMAREMKKKER